MIQIILLLTISINAVLATSSEDCPPEENDVIRSITTLSIPNCRKSDAIRSESRRSLIIETRRAKSLPTPNLPSPICDSCRTDFNAKSSSPVDISEDKKNAFFDTAYNELEKSLSTILVDVVALRKTWSTGSDYSESVRACNTSEISSRLNKCNPAIAAKFSQKNLGRDMANEVAALLNNTNEPIEGILTRSPETRKCNISDQSIAAIRPSLFESLITPSMVQAISRIQASNSSELQAQILSVAGGNLAQVISIHPILKPLMQDPKLFLQTMKSFSSERDPEKLRSKMRAGLFTKELGDAIDKENSEKCTATIQSFTNSLCSEKFKSGNISLGPFNNYDKFINNQQLSDSEVSTSENDLKQNMLMFSFCENTSPANQSLSSTLSSMNNWMLDSDKNSSLENYSSEKYGREFGDFKIALCNMIQNPPASCSADNEQCRLLSAYQESQRATSPEGRIAASSDPGIDKVLRSFVGSPTGLSPKTKDILVTEGIIPQANGKFVERPTPPERDSGYLAGVANGTITPNVSNTQLASNTLPQRQQQSTLQSQQAVFQPQAQTAAIAPSITPNTDDDESEASRAVFNDLEQRRLRNQLQAANNQQRQVPSTRRSNPTQDQFAPLSSNPTIASSSQVVNAPVPGSGANFAPVSNTEARLERDPNAQTKAQRDRNAALAEFQAARENPNAAVGGAGRGPASTDAQAGRTSSGDQTVAMTVSGDIRASLERVLNGSDANGADLRNKIRDQIPFRFQLNNQTFDVQFNNGACVVTSRSNVELARTLQGLFNNSLRSNGRSAAGRSDTLENLRQNLR